MPVVFTSYRKIDPPAAVDLPPENVGYTETTGSGSAGSYGYRTYRTYAYSGSAGGYGSAGSYAGGSSGSVGYVSHGSGFRPVRGLFGRWRERRAARRFAPSVRSGVFVSGSCPTCGG